MRPVALDPAQDVHAPVPLRCLIIRDAGRPKVVEVLLGLGRRGYAVPDPHDHRSSRGTDGPSHAQTKARTSAVVVAARATATSTGARSARAIAATATPRALSSSTRCRSSPKVSLTTRAASNAGASRATTETARGGSSRPPTSTGPAALMAALARATATTVTQSVVTATASDPEALPRRRRSPVRQGA